MLIFVQVRANDSLTSELEQALRALVRAAQSEPGTLEYGVWRDPDDSNVFHVYEKYFGREAFQEHIGNETFKEFAGENVAKLPLNVKICVPLEPL